MREEALAEARMKLVTCNPELIAERVDVDPALDRITIGWKVDSDKLLDNIKIAVTDFLWYRRVVVVQEFVLTHPTKHAALEPPLSTNKPLQTNLTPRTVIAAAQMGH